MINVSVEMLLVGGGFLLEHAAHAFVKEDELRLGLDHGSPIEPHPIHDAEQVESVMLHHVLQGPIETDVGSRPTDAGAVGR